MLTPTILRGGSGSRRCPVTRELHPKPSIRRADGQCLLGKVFLRGAPPPSVAEILTITNRELFFETDDDFRELNTTRLATTFVLEPFGRNTAANIATAAFSVAKAHGEETILLVLVADHLIADEAVFSAPAVHVTVLPQQGKLVACGIQPTSTKAGYGYIEFNGNQVLRFVEKLTLAKAQEYFNSGHFFWSSGTFCPSADRIRKAMALDCPDVLQAVHAFLEKSRKANGKGFSQIELDAVAFTTVPDNSIDYAAMGKTPGVAVVLCNIVWSDIDSGNTRGDLVDPDAILVVDKASAQDVKHIYAKLKALGHAEHNLQRTVHLPLGHVHLEGGRHGILKIKRIEVKPGTRMGLQMRHHRREHCIVVYGMAKVTYGEGEFYVSTNESTYIQADHKAQTGESEPVEPCHDRSTKWPVFGCGRHRPFAKLLRTRRVDR